MSKPKIIAIDFDGTLVTHEFPRVGKEIPGAVGFVQDMMADGHKFILLTMRSGDRLTEAIKWMKARDIEPWAVNSNPTQESWTESRKVYAHMYVDDAAAGCPMMYDPLFSDRPYVDYPTLRKLLEANNQIPKLWIND